MTTPRPHAAMQCQFAMDASLLCWFWNPNFTYWQHESHPAWEDEFVYFVGHTKPTQPPKRMCELGGFVFEAPESVAPAEGTNFWIALAYTSIGHTWRGYDNQVRWLELGLVHLNPEAATPHTHGMAAVNLAAVTGGAL